MNAVLPNGIEYLVQFSNKRKSIAIQIHYQDIIVKAPQGIDPSIIHNFVISKQAWIKRKLISSKPDIEFNQYCANGYVWYMGVRYLLKIEPSLKHIGILKDNTLHLKSKSVETSEIQKQYLKWLHHQANRMLPDLVNHCITRFEKNINVNVKSIKTRRTKSKWGHCTHDQQLQFNWIILMAPPYILEYLICHEIAHLVEKNHSKAFWDLVNSLCEHTQKSEQWLKKNAEVLMQA